MSRAPALNNGMITSPITQSGRVVINARKDTYSIDKRMREITTHDEDNTIGWGGSDGIADENFSVLPHEIAVYDCVRMYESRLAREESVAVITSANGLDVNNWQINDEAEGVAFMGVAMSRALHDSRNAARNEEDCTVQVGGLCTILNNGGKDIKAGEWVAWDYPEPDMYLVPTETATNTVPNGQMYRPATLGTPYSKCQFRVRSYNEMVESITNPEKDCEMHRMKSGQAAEASGFLFAPSKLELKVDVFKAHQVLRKIEGRIFGRAMSSASQGEPVDILLGAHCV